MLQEKYNLNNESFQFILEFEKSVSIGETHKNKELVKAFNNSSRYNEIVKTYSKGQTGKAIWYAISRSGKWTINGNGTYTKVI